MKSSAFHWIIFTYIALLPRAWSHETASNPCEKALTGSYAAFFELPAPEQEKLISKELTRFSSAFLVSGKKKDLLKFYENQKVKYLTQETAAFLYQKPLLEITILDITNKVFKDFVLAHPEDSRPFLQKLKTNGKVLAKRLTYWAFWVLVGTQALSVMNISSSNVWAPLLEPVMASFRSEVFKATEKNTDAPAVVPSSDLETKLTEVWSKANALIPLNQREGRSIKMEAMYVLMYANQTYLLLSKDIPATGSEAEKAWILALENHIEVLTELPILYPDFFSTKEGKKHFLPIQKALLSNLQDLKDSRKIN